MDIPAEKLEICLEVLQQIADDPESIAHEDRIKSLIAKIHKQGRKYSRKHDRTERKIEERQTRENTLIHQLDRQALIQARHNQDRQTIEQTLIVRSQHPEFADDLLERKPEYFQQSVSCYICKQAYREVHFFYHLLCLKCAEFNYAKRDRRADLTGRVALLTGGRIKIGYQLGLRLLQDGARVIITTRFPQDCARRYSLEPDFDRWGDRLQIHGLDLRDIKSLEGFIEYLLARESALDIIINNACQTVKRPLEFYRHLLDREELSGAIKALIPVDGYNQTALLETRSNYREELTDSSQIYFPPQTFDRDGQQVDLRPINSWTLKLDRVSTPELLEVQLVNAIAPFLINSRLKPLLMRSKFARRFIINVSAMEGQFNRKHKTTDHPHTNMAKAALNMMTRTSAADYAEDNIFMNSVDTGWITNENPYPKSQRMEQEQDFYPPLDAIDGMARIYDPIVSGINLPETPLFGHFLKDYFPYPW
ncbi:SDR family NAD(P)-dependent oxidoreductase [Chamaesiphon polymorphus]|uniref:Short-chain dehydrogenase n=1 Tax=Chamaesiphon polymorphus CCALA 037 TaxID=2107692 RepID=A0A2T1GAX6_9CYAN|nr:SDR family oxidoreductase [Chamaesiphon polymorphus]PSB54357.1 short-chain dehydrogenase [Chamaesiphon polymorphus CCALA 037]